MPCKYVSATLFSCSPFPDAGGGRNNVSVKENGINQVSEEDVGHSTLPTPQDMKNKETIVDARFQFCTSFCCVCLIVFFNCPISSLSCRNEPMTTTVMHTATIGSKG